MLKWLRQELKQSFRLVPEPKTARRPHSFEAMIVSVCLTVAYVLHATGRRSMLIAVAACMLGVVALFLARKFMENRRRIHLNRCARCGYDRRGLARGDRCPECGLSPRNILES